MWRPLRQSIARLVRDINFRSGSRNFWWGRSKLCSVCWNCLTADNFYATYINVILHHIPYLHLLRLFDFNWLNERGYRPSRRWHIAESRCFCKRPARLLCEQNRLLEGSWKKYKFQQVWYLVERRTAAQISFLKINQWMVICDPLVVRISVSNHLIFKSGPPGASLWIRNYNLLCALFYQTVTLVFSIV